MKTSIQSSLRGTLLICKRFLLIINPSEIWNVKTIVKQPQHTLQKAHRMIASPAIVFFAFLFICIPSLGAEEFFVDMNSVSTLPSASFDDPFQSIADAVDYIIAGAPVQGDFADIVILPGVYNKTIEQSAQLSCHGSRDAIYETFREIWSF